MSKKIDYPKMVSCDISHYLNVQLLEVESKERTTSYPESAKWAKLADSLKRSIADVRKNCINPMR